MENPTGILEIKRWALIQACCLCFHRSWVCLHTQGLGPKPEDVCAFTLKHFRGPAGSQRDILASEYRSGNLAVIYFHENMNPNRKARKKMGLGVGGRQMPEAAFEIWVPLNAFHLNTFSFHFETLFISQSIKAMCFWFVNTQLIIKVFPDVEETHVDSWVLFPFIAPGKKTNGKLWF